ncbi:hypothetical protein J1614_002788 [Plenodomus biglobosus]|nr:hypothetical protein J1614_002788 [Plenodomus biglobosus]
MMPSLKDLKCSIELSDCQQTLPEFGTSYRDGLVETFVPVPTEPQSFSVHLTSDKFIAPGIAMYVFIDGVYQCNRNRQDLKLRKTSKNRSLVDFRVRQKEEKQKDGSMIAREWKFEKLNTVSAHEATHDCSPDLLANIGCIEVVVLRCAGPRNAKTASQLNMDGANDIPDYSYRYEGQVDETSSDSIYDDRPPFSTSRRNGFGPPPPLGVYQAPYAERVHSRLPARSHRHTDSGNPSIHPSYKSNHTQSRCTGTLAPNTHRASEVPLFGVQYGSGPLPPVGQPLHNPGPGAPTTDDPRFDPQWLDKLVTRAVKKGVEESQKSLTPVGANSVQSQYKHSAETVGYPPGAWPTSPNAAVAQLDQTIPSGQSFEGRGTSWSQSQGDWTQRPAQSKAGSRVTWNDTGLAWESKSSDNGWKVQEETPTDSWDTDETWEVRKPSEWKDDDRKVRSRSSYNRSRRESRRNSRAVSPITIRIREQRGSKDGISVRLRSKSGSRRFRTNEDVPSSSEDTEGWMPNDTTSSSATESSNNTIQPPHSQRQAKTLLSRPQERSRRSKFHHNVKRKPSGHVFASPAWQSKLKPKSVPSVRKEITPTVLDGPASGQTSGLQGVPLNTGFVPGSLPPAPYAPIMPEYTIRKGDANRLGAQLTPFSSWDGEQHGKKENDLWGPAAVNKSAWEGVSLSGWDTSDTDEKGTNGWKATDKKSWSTADAKKYGWAGGWDTDDNKWQAGHPADEQTHKSASLAGWNTRKSGCEANEDVVPSQDHQKKFPWGHLDAHKGKTVPQQKPDTPWVTAPAEDKPAETAWVPKRYSNKTLSKYRQLRCASDAGPKPHWQFPPALEQNLSEHGRPYIAAEEPLLKISKEAASEKGIEHQVQAGKGTQYGHVIGRPDYLDSLEKPYAVFRFKYRSRAMLKSLFGDALIPDPTLLTPVSNLATAKDKLTDLPQHELVEKMLKLQAELADKGYMRGQERSGKKEKEKEKEEEKEKLKEKLKEKERFKEKLKKKKASGSEATEVAARGFTEKWVEMQSRQVNEKGKSGNKERKHTEKESKKGEGWGDVEDWGALGDVKW